MRPPLKGETEEEKLQELAQYGNSIYESITAAEPEATWVMMGWLFIDKEFWTKDRARALLTNVPDTKMMVLDMYAESEPFYSKLDNFFGKPWMFSVIPNWGGLTQPGGTLERYGKCIPEIAKNPNVGHLVAFGYSPEGTENNEVIYELASDAMWSGQPIHVDDWIVEYCMDRYGLASEEMLNAWKQLLQSLYNKEVGHVAHRIQGNPFLSTHWSVPVKDDNVRFAVKQYEGLENKLGNHELFKNDLIELRVYDNLCVTDSLLLALKQRIDILGTNAVTDQMMKQVRKEVVQMDSLLKEHSLFRLERWVENARSWGDTPEEAIYYETDAKRLITVWGSYLTEYAARVWNGLLVDFYLPRWELWYDSQKNKSKTDVNLWQEKWLQKEYKTN